MALRELMSQLHQLQTQMKAESSNVTDLNVELESLKAEIRLQLNRSDEAFAAFSEQEFQSLMADIGDPKQVTVEVVYATKFEQNIQEVQLFLGASVKDCIVMSGILDQCPDIDLAINKVGIYGAVKPLSAQVSDADRIEIYRSVTAKR